MPVTTRHIYNALTQVMPDFVGPIYRELRFETGEIVPTSLDLQPGAELVMQELLDEMAQALILADAMDIPMVELGMTEKYYKTYMVAAGYYFTWKSTRGLNYAGKLQAVASRKLALVSRAIAERIHRFAAVGDVRINERGFLNSDRVPVRASSFDPNSGLTANILRSFLIDAIWNGYTNRTGYTRFPSHILISPKLYRLGTDLLMPDSAVSVIDSVRQSIMSGDTTVAAPSLTISQAPECSAQYLEATGVQPPATGKDRIVVYSRDPLVVTRQAEPMGQIPAEWLGAVAGKQQYANYCCTTPTMWLQGEYGEYIDHTAAA